MRADPDQLAQRLTDAFDGTRTANPHPWLWRPLLRLLARGEPVAIDDLAAATDQNADRVRQALATLPDTEYDDQGRVVGSGLTLRPTPHRFEVDGRQLYTWCALDTLIFPAVLDQPARVSSPCHATGQTVRVTLTPTRVTSVDPPTAVVSIVTPEDTAAIRAAFCNQVHFFASADAAGPWLGEHPGATVRPVRDAFAVGQQIAARQVSDHSSACC